MAIKERKQVRLRVLRGYRPYRVQLIREKQRQLERIIRQMGKYHDDAKGVITIIEKSQKEMRTLRDVNFKGFLDETDESSCEEA